MNYLVTVIFLAILKPLNDSSWKQEIPPCWLKFRVNSQCLSCFNPDEVERIISQTIERRVPCESASRFFRSKIDDAVRKQTDRLICEMFITHVFHARSLCWYSVARVIADVNNRGELKPIRKIQIFSKLKRFLF